MRRLYHFARGTRGIESCTTVAQHVTCLDVGCFAFAEAMLKLRGGRDASQIPTESGCEGSSTVEHAVHSLDIASVPT